MRGRSTRASALLLVLLLLVSATGGEARERKKRKQKYRETHERVAEGVRLTRIRDPKGPWRIYILSIDLAAPSTLDVALGSDQLPGLERTTSMARRQGAIAAINGDYAAPSGRPVFTFAEDGRLAQTPLMWGRNFSVDVAETTTYFGHPNSIVRAHEQDSDALYPIKLVNEGKPNVRQMAQFTADGSYEERPPAQACNARVLPVQDVGFIEGSAGVDADHVVDKVVCGRTLAPRRGSVLSAPVNGSYAFPIANLDEQEVVTLSWSLGWANVLDTIGGNPTLIENGAIVSENVYGSGSFFARHPRTAVAATGDGRLLWVVVDGRQPKRSVGMSLGELARLLKRRGATWALNLDGGGSSTMVVRGQIVNRPSGGYERAVSSALLLLPGPDHGQRTRASGQDGLVSPGLSTTSYDYADIARDPASTGGMLDAAFRTGLHIPRSFLPVLRSFARR